jgi:CRP/FNR family cyclic AMP-dependent transcriptional regulator
VRDIATRVLIRGSPLFRELPPATLERIEKLAVRRAYARNQVVFQQGETGDALYGVSTGKVLIEASGADGRQVSLNIMEPGDVFGEVALLDSGTRSASARALVPSQLIVIQRQHFQELVQREPSVALELLRLMCRRLRWTTDLVEESTLLSVPAQIARRLVTLARISGTPVSGGTELRISQAELAQFLGFSRQAINQHLKRWQREGLVDLKRSRITVRGPRAVRALSKLTESRDLSTA